MKDFLAVQFMRTSKDNVEFLSIIPGRAFYLKFTKNEMNLLGVFVNAFGLFGVS